MVKTTSQLKKSYMKLLYNNPQIVKLIDDNDVLVPDDLQGSHIFPHVKIDFTLQQQGTYICIKLDYPNATDNEMYKNYLLTVMIISNNGHLNTANGDSRTDLLGEEIIKMLNWNSNFGFQLALVSDIEDPLNESFYFRRLIFKSVVFNSLDNKLAVSYDR